MRLILDHHPPLENADNDFNGTPMDWAIHGSENGWNCKKGDYAGVVNVLLDAGAKAPGKVEGSAAVKEVLRARGPG